MKMEDSVRMTVTTLRAAGENWLADQVCAWANARDRGQVRRAKVGAKPAGTTVAARELAELLALISRCRHVVGNSAITLYPGVTVEDAARMERIVALLRLRRSGGGV
jgi:hypothetical protein